SDSKNDIVLLDCFDVIPLPCGSRDNRRLARRSYDLRRGDVAKILVRRLGRRLQSVVKLVLLNIHTFLARLLKLVKHMLRFIDSAWFSLKSYPTFSSGHLHAKRVFQGFQEF